MQSMHNGPDAHWIIMMAKHILSVLKLSAQSNTTTCIYIVINADHSIAFVALRGCADLLFIPWSNRHISC